MGLLEVNQLSKKYGNNDVLKGISFSVKDGEFFVLLGPSGGGKSTILKILCGIETSDAGTIALAGRDITTIPPRDRNIGMVFQDYGLYPHMNVAENIAYGLEARGFPKDEVAKRVKGATDRLGLTPLADHVVVDLSGGEQQRIALARALAKDADIYLFDEPISNLDPKLRAQARRDILMVHRSKQKPSIYVTHDQNEALAIADRIAIIAQGKLQQVGTANDLLQRPANLFVAGFIGTPAMNLLHGMLSNDATKDAYRVYVTLDFSFLLPASWNPSLHMYGKNEIIIGIPPAAFIPPGVVIDEELHEPANYMDGTVDFVDPLVSEVVVNFKLGNDLITSAIFQGVDEAEFQIGSRLRVGIDSNQICLFDPETEQALKHIK